MNLGILLPIGSSFKDQKKSGQDKRFIEYYLKVYNQGFEKVFIFSYEDEKYRLPRNCVLTPNVFRLNRFFYSFLLPLFNWQIIRKIDVFRVMQLTGVIPAILIKIFLVKPFLFTYGYDYSAFAKLEGKKTRAFFLKVLEGLAIKFSSCVIVTNEKIESYFRKKYSKVKLFYIPNGLDINKFKPKTSSLSAKGRSSTGRNHQPLAILSVARLEKQKNLDNLIKAVSLIKNKYKIKLTFIGQGKLKLQLIKLAKKLEVDLKIIDKVPHGQIAKHYQQADIFCLPSFLEGQPKALLEAMACGLPCLVGEYEGVGEFEDDKEILLTGFKAKEISKKLVQLIKNSNLRKKLSKNARNRIEKDFDIEKLLNKEARILQQIVKKNEKENF